MRYVQMQVSCQVSHGLGPNLLLFVVRLSQINDAGPLNFCHKTNKSPVAIFSLVFHLRNKSINRVAEGKKKKKKNCQTTTSK